MSAAFDLGSGELAAQAAGEAPGCTVCEHVSSPHGVPVTAATPGRAAPSLGEVYWLAARERKIAQGGTVPSDWAHLGGHLKEICEAGASAVDAHLAAQDAQPAPGDVLPPLTDAWREAASEIDEGPFGDDQYNAGYVSGLRECAAQLAAREPTPAPELADAKPDLGTAWRLLDESRAALARVLAWFPTSGTRNAAAATRAQLASAYRDGGLDVPEELRRFAR